MKRRMLKIGLLLPLLLMVAACPLEKDARDAIAGAKGFIQEAQRNHLTECRANPELPVCTAINQAVAAQNSAIDALDLYCSGSAYQSGGACQPNKEVEPRLRAAISNLDRIIKNAKGTVGQ